MRISKIEEVQKMV